MAALRGLLAGPDGTMLERSRLRPGFLVIECPFEKRSPAPGDARLAVGTFRPLCRLRLHVVVKLQQLDESSELGHRVKICVPATAVNKISLLYKLVTF